jgi:hypothetical protein
MRAPTAAPREAPNVMPITASSKIMRPTAAPMPIPIVTPRAIGNNLIHHHIPCRRLRQQTRQRRRTEWQGHCLSSTAKSGSRSPFIVEGSSRLCGLHFRVAGARRGVESLSRRRYPVGFLSAHLGPSRGLPWIGCCSHDGRDNAGANHNNRNKSEYRHPNAANHSCMLTADTQVVHGGVVLIGGRIFRQ